MRYGLGFIAFAVVLFAAVFPQHTSAKTDDTEEILSGLERLRFRLDGVAKMKEEGMTELIARDIEVLIEEFKIEVFGNEITASFDCKDKYGYTPTKGYLKITMVEDAEKISSIEGHIAEISSDVTFEFDFAFKDLPMQSESGSNRMFRTDLKKLKEHLVRFNVVNTRYRPVFDDNLQIVSKEYEGSGKMAEYMLGQMGERKRSVLSKDDKPVYGGLHLEMRYGKAPDKGTRVRLMDENLKVFTMKHPFPDNIEIPSHVKFLITRVDWQKLGMKDASQVNASRPLILKYNLTARIKDKNGTERWKQEVEDAGSEILAKAVRHKVERDRIMFFEPLGDFLQRVPTNMVEVLVDQHYFKPRFADLPDETILTVEIEPIELYCMTGTPPKKHSIDLKKNGITSANYVFGWEISMEAETYLMGKDGKPTSWEDKTEIYMTATKLIAWAFGVELVTDIIDVGMELVDIMGHALNNEVIGLGEGICDVLASALPAPLEFITAGPEVYRVGKEKDACLASKQQQDQMRADLKSKGYLPINKFRASRDLPLWVNLKTEKLAFMDQTGIVHRVKQPRGFNIALPFFEIYKASPESAHFLVYPKGVHQQKPEWDWKELGYGKKYLVVPPARQFAPTTISLVWKEVPGLEHPKLAEGLYIRTAKKGTIYIDNKAMVDFGWMDDSSARLVLKKPYVCLIRGRLMVKNVEDRIGVGFYKYRYEDGKMERFVPRAWLQPKGTTYTVNFDPSSEQLTVAVEEGSVEVLGHDEAVVAAVDAGEEKTFSLAEALGENVEPTKDKGQEEESEQVGDEGEGAEVGVVFADNFDSDNGGRGNLHYRGFRQWLVRRGEVDLVGKGFRDYQPGHGLYLDLKGTPIRPNTRNTEASITTKTDITLEPGEYLLSFLVAGNPNQGPDTVEVDAFGVFSTRVTVDRQAAGTGFKKIEESFTVTRQTTGRLAFSERTGPGQGALLDEILIRKVGP